MEKVQEIIAKLKVIKAEKGYSNQEIADLTEVPKGTVDRVFGNKFYNFTYESIQPIVSLLLKIDEPGKENVPLEQQETIDLLKKVIMAKNSDLDNLRDEKQELRNELSGLRESYERHIKTLTDSHKEEIANIRATHKERIAELKVEQKEEVAQVRKAYKFYRIMLIILSLIIVLLLIVDIANPTFGWIR